MKCARIDNGRVAEIVTIPEGLLPEECFTPDIVAALVPCDGSVAEGMAWDGVAFQPPPPPSPEEANRSLFAEIASLETRTLRPLGDALMYRAEGRTAEAEAEEVRVAQLRRQILALRQGLAQ